jgi:GNAT superfamily N-acetyltransferase
VVAGVVIRDLTVDDAAFQADMLYAAACWRPGVEQPAPDLLLSRPEARRYLDGGGRLGDLGVIAELDGRPAGAAWCRLFTEADHGDGFVDEGTPELAIGVRDDARGQGIGRRLMVALHDRARAAGVATMALSAEQDNDVARGLYRSLGYVDLAPADPKDRMILDL